MQINLVGIEPKLIAAWQQLFKHCENVSIIHDSIFNLKADAIVSPANSFGYMNGGIDFTISKTMGWHIEKRLQEKIRTEFYGELLVGQATYVETDHSAFPFLISAPTMRTPMTIIKSPNVYLAMKAILNLIKFGKTEKGEPLSTKITSIAIPGLGTGIGQVPAMHCARQMRLAYEDVFGNMHATKERWNKMTENFAYFYTQDERDIKYDLS